MTMSERAFYGLRRIYDAMPERVQHSLEPARRWVVSIHSQQRMNNQVAEACDDVRLILPNYNGDKVLVDCGFNNGKAAERFMHELPDFKVYGFEINPEFRDAAERLKREYPNFLGVNFSAVSDRDGEVEFWLAGEPNKFNPHDGTTIMPGKIAGNPDHGKTLVAPSVDFSKWLRDKFYEHVTIGADGRREVPLMAVKMDIEGAEVPVLEHMINEGTLDYMDVLIVEFHARCFSKAERAEVACREQRILRTLEQDSGVLIHQWH